VKYCVPTYRYSERWVPSPASGDVEMRAILGEHVSGVESLHLARAKPQRALTHAVLATAERNWRLDASRADCTRLTDASGPESAWVGQCPTRPQYVFTSSQWRDAISTRLGVPLSFLQQGPDVPVLRLFPHGASDRLI
jgi:hypothetical protein